MTKDNTIALQTAKLEAENRQLKTQIAALKGSSLTDLVQLAEMAFATRNHAAVAAQAQDEDGFGNGTEVEFKPHWHWVRPLQAALDGLHKALHGSVWNGREIKGACALLDDLKVQAARRMPGKEAIESFGGDVLKALEADPNAHAVFQAIGDQEVLISKLQDLSDALKQAFEVVSNGGEYQPPAARAAAYADREKAQAETTASVDQLLAALAAGKRAAE